MRELKFRGIGQDGKTMFYGLLSIVPDNYDLGDVKPGHYISNSYGCPYAYKIIPDTLGQYTGIKDENDKEIYEGDILRYLESGNPYESEPDIVDIGKVYWEEDIPGFKIQYCEDNLELAEAAGHVIGNIHQDRELLPEYLQGEDK